jgi:hypothetical protein
MNVKLTEADRHFILLALARLAAERPVWQAHLSEPAGRLQGERLFRELLALVKEEVPRAVPPQSPRSDEGPRPGSGRNGH